MDKEKREIFALPKRRGFTLLLTLSVMTVIIALMAVVVRYYAEAKAEADRTAALLQANLFYATVAEGLASIPQQKELLDFLYTTSVPLMTDDGRGSILLTCVPASYGVNINWLSYPHDANKSYLYETTQELMDFISSEYTLRDPMQLQEMLLRQITGGNTDVTGEMGRLRQNHGIISFKQFERLLTEYQMQADDTGVGQIPWRSYLSFTGDKIDGDHAPAQLISYLFDIDIVLVNDWKNSLDPVPLQEFVNANGGTYASKSRLFYPANEFGETRCDVGFVYNSDAYGFSFYYLKGGSKHFEFHGKE